MSAKPHCYELSSISRTEVRCRCQDLAAALSRVTEAPTPVKHELYAELVAQEHLICDPRLALTVASMIDVAQKQPL